MGDFERRYGITDTQLSKADGEERGKQIFCDRSKIVLSLLLANKQGLTAREVHVRLQAHLGKVIEIHSTRPILTRLGPDTPRGINADLIHTIGRKEDQKTGIKISVWAIKPDSLRTVRAIVAGGTH